MWSGRGCEGCPARRLTPCKRSDVMFASKPHFMCVITELLTVLQPSKSFLQLLRSGVIRWNVVISAGDHQHRFSLYHQVESFSVEMFLLFSHRVKHFEGFSRKLEALFTQYNIPGDKYPLLISSFIYSFSFRKKNNSRSH